MIRKISSYGWLFVVLWSSLSGASEVTLQTDILVKGVTLTRGGLGSLSLLPNGIVLDRPSLVSGFSGIGYSQDDVLVYNLPSSAFSRFKDVPMLSLSSILTHPELFDLFVYDPTLGRTFTYKEYLSRAGLTPGPLDDVLSRKGVIVILNRIEPSGARPPRMWIVTPSAGPNGIITPHTPQMVTHGATKSFTVTSNEGYHADMGGTCGGTLNGNTYTTNPINGNCSVIATFSPNTCLHTVTPFAGTNGSINPSTPQTVKCNDALSFSVTPSDRYTATVGGTCGGSPASGSSQFTYTTNPIISNCTVSVTFATGQVAGACGLANGQTFMTKPALNLCSAGIESAVTGSGPWSWSCAGLNEGATAFCYAEFQKSLPVLRICGNNELWYSSLQSAYDASSSNDFLLTSTGDFYQNLYFDRDISVTIQGGCSQDFTSVTGYSSISGTMTISAGTVSVFNVILK